MQVAVGVQADPPAPVVPPTEITPAVPGLPPLPAEPTAPALPTTPPEPPEPASVGFALVPAQAAAARAHASTNNACRERGISTALVVCRAKKSSGPREVPSHFFVSM